MKPIYFNNNATTPARTGELVTIREDGISLTSFMFPTLNVQRISGIDSLKKIGAMLLSIFFCGCGTSYKYLSKSPLHSPIIGKAKIDVYVVSTHRKITYHYFSELEDFGKGADLRYVSDMLTPGDSLSVGLGSALLLFLPLLTMPRTVELDTRVNPIVRVNELQKSLGDDFFLIDKTGEYRNEKEFINHEKKGNNLFMIYHTCDLEGYPLNVDYSGNHYVQYKVNAVTVRIFLFDGSLRILDYRDALVANRISQFGETTSVFETLEMLNGRRVEKGRDQIKYVLRK